MMSENATVHVHDVGFMYGRDRASVVLSGVLESKLSHTARGWLGNQLDTLYNTVHDLNTDNNPVIKRHKWNEKRDFTQKLLSSIGEILRVQSNPVIPPTLGPNCFWRHNGVGGTSGFHSLT